MAVELLAGVSILYQPEQAGPDGAKTVKDLRWLLPLKTKTQYEPDDIALGIAQKAVERGVAGIR